jgi:hypothetical protein
VFAILSGCRLLSHWGYLIGALFYSLRLIACVALVVAHRG